MLNPSGDTTGKADLASLQSMASAGQGLMQLGPGAFYLDGDLDISKTAAIIAGSGRAVTSVHQTATTAHGIYAQNQSRMTIRDLTLVGPGSGSGNGIHLDSSGGAVQGVTLKDLVISGFGGLGVFGNIMITSRISNVDSVTNRGGGFFFSGGTSLTMDSCYANGCGGDGYEFASMVYCTLNACACDNAGADAYYVRAGGNIVMNGCGAEIPVTGYHISQAESVVLNGCYVCQETASGFLVDFASKGVTMVSPREVRPRPGAISVQTKPNTTTAIISPILTSKPSYAPGTVTGTIALT